MVSVYDLLETNPDAAYSEEELYRRFTANAPGSYIDTSHLDIALQKVVELACVEARSVANATYYAFLCEIDKETWVLVADESDEADEADAPDESDEAAPDAEEAAPDAEAAPDEQRQRPTSSPRTRAVRARSAHLSLATLNEPMTTPHHLPTPLLVIVGPTAVGKSDLALHLARRFGGEIINADSRQVYRGMELGTAAPTASAMAASSSPPLRHRKT